MRLSRLVEEIPEISELDLNPILAQPPGQGCRIVDARIRVENLKGVGAYGKEPCGSRQRLQPGPDIGNLLLGQGAF